MSSYNNIHTVAEIGRRVARGDRNFGRVSIKEDGKYLLLNYTTEALFKGKMTKAEQACRGLVIRSDGKIMALPMPKFYNLGEPDCPPLPDESYSVWEKADGSLVLFWHDGERWRCNTRGRFRNMYSDFAWQLWLAYGGGAEFPVRWTVMCEVCIDDDEMPRAAYMPEGLYLVAIRDRYSGLDLDLRRIPTDLLKVECYGDATIESLVERQKDVEGAEGWVVRFDGGLRVKLKTVWYLRMFRALKDLTAERIREFMLDGWEKWIRGFPDDLRPSAIAMKDEITGQLGEELRAIYWAYSRVAGIPGRKEFALEVQAVYPDVAHWLFKLRDSKFQESEVLEHMDLSRS